MKVKKLIIDDSIQINLLPTAYTFQIGDKIFDSDDYLEESTNDPEELLEIAGEHLCIELANIDEDALTDEFYDKLHSLSEQI